MNYDTKLHWTAHCSKNGIDMLTSVNTFLKCSIEGDIYKGYTLEARNTLNSVRYRLERKSINKVLTKAQKLCDKNFPIKQL